MSNEVFEDKNEVEGEEDDEEEDEDEEDEDDDQSDRHERAGCSSSSTRSSIKDDERARINASRREASDQYGRDVAAAKERKAAPRG